MIGHYVVLEGIEGAGKSTVAARVADELERRGLDVLLVREPGSTPQGERIRSLLLDSGTDLEPWTEALLFAAARAQLAASVVGPALADGRWVVSDRSVYSSLAYQGAGRGLGIETVKAVNDTGLQGVWPELVVLLRVDAGQGLARQAVADRIGGEGVELQRTVSAAFDTLAAAEPDRFTVVDAEAPIDRVVEQVLAVMESKWVMSSTM